MFRGSLSDGHILEGWICKVQWERTIFFLIISILLIMTYKFGNCYQFNWYSSFYLVNCCLALHTQKLTEGHCSTNKWPWYTEIVNSDLLYYQSQSPRYRKLPLPVLLELLDGKASQLAFINIIQFFFNIYKCS